MPIAALQPAPNEAGKALTMCNLQNFRKGRQYMGGGRWLWMLYKAFEYRLIKLAVYVTDGKKSCTLLKMWAWVQVVGHLKCALDFSNNTGTVPTMRAELWQQAHAGGISVELDKIASAPIRDKSVVPRNRHKKLLVSMLDPKNNCESQSVAVRNRAKLNSITSIHFCSSYPET